MKLWPVLLLMICWEWLAAQSIPDSTERFTGRKSDSTGSYVKQSSTSTRIYSGSGREAIYSKFALYDTRTRLEKELREKVVAQIFSQPFDLENEYRWESACLAISQFQFKGETVKSGLDTLFAHYDSLQYDTRRALLEAVYGVYPNSFGQEVQRAIANETHPKLFAMCAVYLYREDPSVNAANTAKIKMVEAFPAYDSLDLLLELEQFLNHHVSNRRHSAPAFADLFAHQRTHGLKNIYSLQRWDRDYPGLAIVQRADGRFMRHPDGRLMVFEQLARSASDLPYFITNGSTPQGVYSIQGTAVSGNSYIGPTPNLQLLMPYEGKWENYFHYPPFIAWDSARDIASEYRTLFPASWRGYAPVTEVLMAGKIGRTEIIAHGTTIDPAYFADKPYYPLTPTMGCLCAKELWNTSTGRLLVSEQWNLVSAFSAAPGSNGYLYVINLDDQRKPVSRAEVEALVRAFEKRL